MCFDKKKNVLLWNILQNKLSSTNFVLFQCCIKILGSFVQNKQVSLLYCLGLVHSGCGAWLAWLVLGYMK